MRADPRRQGECYVVGMLVDPPCAPAPAQILLHQSEISVQHDGQGTRAYVEDPESVLHGREVMDLVRISIAGAAAVVAGEALARRGLRDATTGVEIRPACCAPTT